MAISLHHTAAGRVLRALGIIGLGVGLVCLIIFAEFASVMFEVFSGIDWTTDSVINQRGDKVEASTRSTDQWQEPYRTVVRLRRAHAWFSTTLVAADSFGVQEHLEWVDNDTLKVTLGFGCLKHMTRPVEQVGSIRVSYHLHNGDETLSKGCPGPADSSLVVERQ